MDLRENIVPIMGEGEDGVTQFIGTGFFVSHSGIDYLVTADHVIKDWVAELNILLPIAMTHNGIQRQEWNINAFRADPLVREHEADLAALRVRPYKPPNPFIIAKDEEIIFGKSIACFEYSTTRKVEYYFEFTPAFRVGNITRIFRNLDTDKLPRKAREGVIEVSFPALQGASGAPVFIQGTNKLLGILSHNNDYYTTPEPIITLRDEEESKDKKGLYVIPHALAVHVKHLRKILEELSCNE